MISMHEFFSPTIYMGPLYNEIVMLNGQKFVEKKWRVDLSQHAYLSNV